MDIAVEDIAGGVTRIVLKGRFDTTGAVVVELPFNRIVTEENRIMDDLSAVTFLASYAIRVLLVLFYLWSSTLKFNAEWISGAALPVADWIIPASLAAAACVYLIVLEAGMSWGLLAQRGWIFWGALAQFCLFHAV